MLNDEARICIVPAMLFIYHLQGHGKQKLVQLWGRDKKPDILALAISGPSMEDIIYRGDIK